MREDETTMGPSGGRAKAAPRPTLRFVFSGRAPTSAQHALRPGSTPIGRSVDSVLGIKIESDPRLSREHAAIVVDGGRVRIVNKSQHGTQRNGARVEDAELTDGDVLRLGDSFAVFRLVPADVVDAPQSPSSTAKIVGVSPSAARLRSTVKLVAPTTASVLLLGPTGAGKDVMARAIHDESGRKGAFVAVNATAIPESLAESQLFGHVAGSFTGAKGDHPGWFRQADGGTLFLDEVGDIPLALQPKLLRVLDEKRVTPIGAASAVPVDVRVIAATNADLEERVHEGKFRGDLHARLAEITVHLPSLAVRKEDVVALLEHALPRGHAPFEPELVAALLAYEWPYNVREVMKVATELAVRGTGRDLLTLDLVEDRLKMKPRSPTPNPSAPAASSSSSSSDVVPVPDKEQLLELMKKYKGVIADIARATGRSRKQVYRWLDKYGLRDDASTAGDDDA